MRQEDVSQNEGFNFTFPINQIKNSWFSGLYSKTIVVYQNTRILNTLIIKK